MKNKIGLSLLDYEDMARVNIEPMNCKSIKDIQGNPMPLENSLRSLLQAPRSNMAHSFPVTIEDMSYQENLKIQCLL